MNLSKLLIENYKSISRVEIDHPNAFSVFAGPNASGKSNIFEAIQFAVTLSQQYGIDTARALGNIIPHRNESLLPIFKAFFGTLESAYTINAYDSKAKTFSFIHSSFLQIGTKGGAAGVTNYEESPGYIQFYRGFSRIFIKNDDLDKRKDNDDFRLSLAARNLEPVLKRVLTDPNKKEEIFEWLQLFIPGFEKLDIRSSDGGEGDELLVFEKGNSKPFTKTLISDGTFNIIALLAAVYQSDEPQFICIEEPENGLNPKVVKELVTFFREQCEEKGHYIWLNTHSQTLVRELTTKEIIIVDKKDGETKIKQIQDMNLHGLKMDEALLSGAIGGGIPW